jgi:hypothetical protein
MDDMIESSSVSGENMQPLTQFQILQLDDRQTYGKKLSTVAKQIQRIKTRSWTEVNAKPPINWPVPPLSRSQNVMKYPSWRILRLRHACQIALKPDSAAL